MTTIMYGQAFVRVTSEKRTFLLIRHKSKRDFIGYLGEKKVTNYLPDPIGKVEKSVQEAAEAEPRPDGIKIASWDLKVKLDLLAYLTGGQR